MDGGITNFFGETYGWDVLAQGVIFTAVLFLSIVVIKSERFKSKDILRAWIDLVTLDFVKIPTKKPSDDKAEGNAAAVEKLAEHFLPSAKSLIIVVIGVGIIYTVGIGINQLADKWMDRFNFLPYYALSDQVGDQLFATDSLTEIVAESAAQTEECRCIESLPKDTLGGVDFDYGIKIQTFNTVFPDFIETVKDSALVKDPEFKYLLDIVDHDLKSDIYYAARHMLLEDDRWKEYLNTNQIAINLLQVVTFSLALLLLACVLRLTINVLSYYWKADLFKILFTALLLSLIAMIYGQYCQIKPIISGASIVLLLLFLIIVVLGCVTRAAGETMANNTRKFFIFICMVLVAHWTFSFSWIYNEKEICYKTYGFLRILAPDKLKNRELQAMKKYLYPVSLDSTESDSEDDKD